MAAKHGTGIVDEVGVNWMGLEKGILRDCGARYDDMATNRNRLWLFKIKVLSNL